MLVHYELLLAFISSSHVDDFSTVRHFLLAFMTFSLSFNIID